MRQAWNIFLKDSREQLVPIVVMVGVLVAFVVATPALLPLYGLGMNEIWGGGAPFIAVSRGIPFLLFLVWGYLIAQVVFADAPHGDRQFWLTRPYKRSSLLAGKLLFVLAYVSVPLALAQVGIVMLSGSSMSGAWSGLLWAQVCVAGLLAGPLLALAAMSVSLSWFVVVLVPVAGVLAASVSGGATLGRFDWVRLSLLASWCLAIVTTVLFVQYRWRRTGRARFVVASGLAGVLILSYGVGWDTAFAVQQVVNGGADGALTASLAPVDPRVAGGARGAAMFNLNRGETHLPIWIDLSGVKSDHLIACEATRVTVRTRTGYEWRDEVRPSTGGRLTRVDEGCSAGVAVPLAAQRLLNERVSLDVNLYITLFEAARVAEVPVGGRRSIAGVGECAADERMAVAGSGDVWRFIDLACDTPFRPPTVAISFGASSILWPIERPSYSPWPADLRLQPVSRLSQSFRTPAAAMAVETHPVRGHMKLRVVAEDVDLRDYMRVAR